MLKNKRNVTKFSKQFQLLSRYDDFFWIIGIAFFLLGWVLKNLWCYVAAFVCGAYTFVWLAFFLVDAILYLIKKSHI
ncbi:hypothetical protein EFP95_16140 [Lentilactobacillus hilgardii]|nr:hypothetical protein [Lentilactobacillus hilgardii]